MSNFDPEWKNTRSQGETIDFAMKHLFTIHCIVCGLAVVLWATTHPPGDMVYELILIAGSTFAFPLMIAPILAVGVNLAIPTRVETANRIIHSVAWIIEVSLFGWFLIVLLDAPG